MNVSVIFATYNRSDVIRDVLEQWKKVDKSTKYTYEIICSDDASSDNTVEIIREYMNVLPITILENEHGGASRARNAALKIAKGEIVIFTGDDIFPEENFVNAHYENYLEFGDSVGTLGKIEWHPDIKMNHLMYHITNVGCEQFGFAGLPPYSKVDFRHFYTSNFSVSRKMLEKQPKYFDLTFDRYGFEDIELGYRLSKDGVSFYYDASILAYHHHVYDDVDKFCNRQMSAGNQMVVFAKIHEDLKEVPVMGIESFEYAIENFVDYSEYEISERGNEILAYIEKLKQRTREIEDVLEKENEWALKAECSALYSLIFQFSMFLGWALRLTEDKNVDKSLLAEAIFQYMYPGKTVMYWRGFRGGYSEENAEYLTENVLRKKVQYKHKKTFFVRLDPCDKECIVKNLNAYAVFPNGKTRKLSLVRTNGQGEDGLDFSLQEDPQIEFKGFGNKSVDYIFEMDVYERRPIQKEIKERIIIEENFKRDYSLSVEQPQKVSIFINNMTGRDLQSVYDEYSALSWLIYRDDVIIEGTPNNYDFRANYNYDITGKVLDNKEFVMLLNEITSKKCSEIDFGECGKIYLRFMEGK